MTKDFLVVYAKYKDSNLSGFAPDVPGCVSAGDDLEKMEAMMREALESHLELLAERGYGIPEPAAENVQFKAEDFEDTEYFVVKKLQVRVPTPEKNRESVRAA